MRIDIYIKKKTLWYRYVKQSVIKYIHIASGNVRGSRYKH